VVDETLRFLLYEAGARVAVSVLDMIRSSPSLRVLHVSEEVEGEADAAFRRFASSRVSYTDCTSQILMQREGIDTAFSFDRDLETLGFRRIP
jgi:predicted nucleic acid-binding protein